MLEELLLKRSPPLKAAFAQNQLDFEDLTTCWFPCLFACTLPAETTARVWDCLLCEGPKVLFRVALALLKVSGIGHFGIAVWSYPVILAVLS